MSIASLVVASGYGIFGPHGSPSAPDFNRNYLASANQPPVTKTSTLIHTTTMTRPAPTVTRTRTITAPAHTIIPSASTITLTETIATYAPGVFTPMTSTVTYTKIDHSVETKTVHGGPAGNAMQCVCNFSGTLKAIPGAQEDITITESSDVD